VALPLISLEIDPCRPFERRKPASFRPFMAERGDEPELSINLKFCQGPGRQDFPLPIGDRVRTNICKATFCVPRAFPHLLFHW
jgi:hypothetical protein